MEIDEEMVLSAVRAVGRSVFKSNGGWVGLTAVRDYCLKELIIEEQRSDHRLSIDEMDQVDQCLIGLIESGLVEVCSYDHDYREHLEICAFKYNSVLEAIAKT